MNDSRIRIRGGSRPALQNFVDRCGSMNHGGAAVVVWALEPRADQDAPAVLQSALTQGITAFSELVREEADRHATTSIVNVVMPGDGIIHRVLTAAVAALSRSWARELARYGTTVNTISYDDASLELTWDALGFLVHPDAAWITGQALGEAGRHLAEPAARTKTEFRPARVLVSGGAGEIGGAITRALLAAGHEVVIGYTRERPAAELASAADPSGRRCTILPLDLTDPVSVSAAVASSVELGVDGLAICGGWNVTKRLWDATPDETQRTLEINLVGPMRLLDGLQSSLELSTGTVVGISSESARNGDAGRSVYAGAKAGLSRLLTETHVSSEVLRCLSISPGPIDSPLMRSTHGDDPIAASEGIERLRRLVPLRRLGRAEEIAHGVTTAFSSHGAFLGGEVLSIGGGVSMS